MYRNRDYDEESQEDFDENGSDEGFEDEPEDLQTAMSKGGFEKKRNSAELQGEVGFLPQIMPRQFQYKLEQKELPKLKREVVILVDTDNSVIALTKDTRIYRMRKGKTAAAWEKLLLPQIVREIPCSGAISSHLGNLGVVGNVVGTVGDVVGTVGKGVKNVGGLGVNFIKKNVMMIKNKNTHKIDKIFMDPNGFHCIFHSYEIKESFYLSNDQERIIYCQDLRGVKITSWAWGTPKNITSKKAINVLIAADTEIFLAKMSNKKRDASDNFIVEVAGKVGDVIETVKGEYNYLGLKKESLLKIDQKDRIFEMKVHPSYYLTLFYS